MKRKIERLTESVINQIAAGEVVENPASIVKELIENSLDANSSWISIKTQKGGFEEILIEDDGCGMNEEDALLSLERHATSKISSIEDLDTLGSMGFRGEALAAISSVSKLELRTSDGIKGTKVVSHGGKVTEVIPCARNQGTTIQIHSLFYNVPARKKFQKSVNASQFQIRKVVETIAIGNPQVAFSYNGRDYAPTDEKTRIEEILGPHEHTIEDRRIHGFVASPQSAMSNRTGQYIFINRRPIFSFLISKAVKEAFATRIGEHEYPRFVLFLELDPQEVDVNVHPQKKEARFKNEGKIFQMVQEAITKTFAPEVKFEEPITFTKPFEAETSSFTQSFPTLPLKVEEVDLDFIYQERVLGIFGKFLLLQKESLLLIDLKALHARVLFESLTFHRGEPQMLMVPIEIEIFPEEEKYAPRLIELGIECRVLKRMLVIDALPSSLDPAYFIEFFEKFKEGKKLEDISSRFIRSSKKAYSLDEALLLWKRGKKCKDAVYDPLGNSIYREIREEDLEKFMLKKALNPL